jgi:hypothetical protein
MRAAALGAFAGLVLGAGLVVGVTAAGLVKVHAPETCFLGFPNSGNTIVFELTGKGAWDVCDDLTNPIGQINALQGARALAGNSWAPRRLCQFDKYGLTWTVWFANQPFPAGASNPCSGGV